MSFVRTEACNRYWWFRINDLVHRSSDNLRLIDMAEKQMGIRDLRWWVREAINGGGGDVADGTFADIAVVVSLSVGSTGS